MPPQIPSRPLGQRCQPETPRFSDRSQDQAALFGGRKREVGGDGLHYGRLLKSVDIVPGVDQIAFDPGDQRIYCASGDQGSLGSGRDRELRKIVRRRRNTKGNAYAGCRSRNSFSLDRIPERRRLLHCRTEKHPERRKSTRSIYARGRVRSTSRPRRSNGTNAF